MYEQPDNDTMKYEILPHLSVAKRGHVSKRYRVEVIQCNLYKSEIGCRWQITSAFP